MIRNSKNDILTASKNKYNKYMEEKKKKHGIELK